MKNKGFTLIELLVVVSIIAILSVIGLAVYANAQKNTKDGIRRVEINSLAKSIESNKDPTTSNYNYTGAAFNNDYPTNKPRDPFKNASKSQYCVKTDSAVISDPLSWAETSVCPTGFVYIISELGNYNTDSVPASSTYNALNVAAGVRYWKICARLEITAIPFCQGNLQ